MEGKLKPDVVKDQRPGFRDPFNPSAWPGGYACSPSSVSLRTVTT